MTDLLSLTTPVIKLNGAPLSPRWLELLRSMRIEHKLCMVSRAVLRFADTGYELSHANGCRLGSTVSMSVNTGVALFDGLVTGIELEQSTSHHPELLVTIDGAGIKLTRGTNTQTYVKQNYQDIIKKIVQAAGLKVTFNGCSGLDALCDYTLQSSSNLAFIDEIARRTGNVWWVEKDTFVMCGPGASTGNASATLGTSLDEFSVRASGLRSTEVEVRGWDAVRQDDIVGKSSAPPNTADSDFVRGYLAGTPGGPLGAAKQSATLNNPNTNSEAGILAKAMYSQAHSGAVVASGSGLVNAAIKPMVMLAVLDAGPASGNYQVSEVEHRYGHNGFFTRFVAGPLRPESLVDTLGAGRPPEVGFSVSGLLTAAVSDISDPDNLGRVKVVYHATNRLITSDWARVATIGAGNDRGSVFQPEVGDEVLVGFERGDSRHPVVLGGLHSPRIKLAADPSVIQNGKVRYRRITSRVGHVVELLDDDSPTKQHIQLKLASGTEHIRIGGDRIDVETSAGKPIAIKSGAAKFEIDASGNITIQGTKITIKADTEVSIQGVQIAVKANAQASVAAAVVDVKADGVANVQASGMLNLKGAAVKIN